METKYPNRAAESSDVKVLSFLEKDDWNSGVGKETVPGERQTEWNQMTTTTTTEIEREEQKEEKSAAIIINQALTAKIRAQLIASQ